MMEIFQEKSLAAATVFTTIRSESFLSTKLFTRLNEAENETVVGAANMFPDNKYLKQMNSLLNENI